MEEEKPRVNERRALALEIYKSGWNNGSVVGRVMAFPSGYRTMIGSLSPPAIHLYIRQVIRRPRARPGLPGPSRSARAHAERLLTHYAYVEQGPGTMHDAEPQ